MYNQDFAGVTLATNLGNTGCPNISGQFAIMDGNSTTLGGFAANGANDPNQWFSTKNANGTAIFKAPAAGTLNTQRVRDLIYRMAGSPPE